MSRVEELLAEQEKIASAIETLYANFKKDGAERKTPEYIQRRLDSLDKYWSQFNNNHFTLVSIGDASLHYFTSERHGVIQSQYQKVRDNIKNYLPSRSMGAEERPTTPVLKPPSFVLSNPQAQDRATSSKTEDMLKKQLSNFRAYMRTVSGINLDLVSEKWEFEDLLQTLQSRWSVIDKLHWELDSELNSTNKEYEQEFSKYESHYNNIKKSINKKMWSVAHIEKTTPKMDIPMFTGSYSQWIPFKDLFTETIHRNPSLSDAQKLQFLKGKLRGEPEKLIQHLQISSTNYAVSWSILTNRYDNVRLIFTAHANTLLNIPIIQQQSANGIKRIHDITNECLNAIKNLGIDTDSWDPLLVHILSQKLDTDSYQDYMESVSQPRAIPNLQEFLQFLETKFTTLESSRRKHDNVVKKSSEADHHQVSKNTSNAYLKPNVYKNSFSSSTRVIPPRSVNNIDNKNVKTFSGHKYWCAICNINEHGIFHCKKFLDMQPSSKKHVVDKHNLCHNCLYNHYGQPCKSSKRCRECNNEHNSLLHDVFQPSHVTPRRTRPETGSLPAATGPQTSLQVQGSSHVSLQGDPIEVLLPTALVEIKAADGSHRVMRALLDQGSQTSLISENAAQILKLQRHKCKGVISGVGDKENNCKGMINIQCRSLVENFTFETDVFVMKTLIKNLPSCTTPKPDWVYLNNIKLADPEFYLSRPVDILLGADVYSLIIMEGICRQNPNLPTAQQTRLGWILSGNVKTFQCNVVLNDISGIERFWETEDITESTDLSAEDLTCVQFYQKTTTRSEDGRYVVRIPFKSNYQGNLGESKNKARAQFYQLERKLQRQPEIAKQYKSFINEYMSLGHMTLGSRDKVGNMKPSCYLPHHCVQRDESTTTKLRVVFNASAKTSTGFSLNDVMCRGPNLQQDLQSLIIKWRQFKFAYTADIEKMFRQIWVHPLDQSYQKILWRDQQTNPVKEYQLATVTYGTKAAPFLAMMTLKQLAHDERPNFGNSDAPEALEGSFYMDDLLHGSHSVESAKQLQHDIIELLKLGGFNLRKWKANSAELLGNVICDQDTFDFKQIDSVKTLGLGWNPKTDNFLFQPKLGFNTKAVLTKRTFLSEMSKLYDPLGWLSPLTIKFKILFQDVWKSKVQWNEPIPIEIKNEWVKILKDITVIHDIKIPRWLQTSEHDTIELHGFSDASTRAYACVVYCRIKKGQNSTVVLVAGKTKLVSLDKNITLPRLELNGAVLLSKLMAKIKECLNNYQISMYGWVDSMAVLGWLNGDAEKWKPYVANRVRKVIAVMSPNCWQYIKSKENPADCASRGLNASQLKEHELWWQGPKWLPNYVSDQQIKTNQFSTNLELRKCKQVNATVVENVFVKELVEELLQKYSSLNKAIRILAWIYRLVRRKGDNYLSIDELARARKIIIKQVQQGEFLEETSGLRQTQILSKKSKILNLNPVLDKDGLLRVGGRLRHANMDPDMKHPLIIPRSRLAELIIDEAHKTTFHGGPKLTTSFIRQKYWLIGGTRAVKKRLRECVKCKRQNPRMTIQMMGDLPSPRVNPSRPFYHTGVDYTGHVFIKANKGRGVKTTKGYVAIFVCMATKAVHLELVSDMTSSTFLAALRRLAARRGVPGHMYSDQGSNFIGANKVLRQEYENILESVTQPICKSEVAKMGIKWHFNAPSWPSAGGLWEAAVKSLKYHLKRVIGEQRLTYEEFGTLLAQIEGCLNSRPLCSVSEDPEELDYITPSHFLSSGPLLTIYETEKDLRTRWQLVQKIVNDLWERWRREYLTQLSARSKWQRPRENIKIGDVVVIQDDNLPPGKWALGKVTQLHPGCDNYVRVVTLKTKNGFIKRPIIKLSILTSDSKEQQEQSQDQQANQQDKELKSSKPFRNKPISFTKLAMSVLFFFMAIVPSQQAAYNITSLHNNNSLYFDPITNMHLIRDHWRLVVYYDTHPYQEGNTTLQKYIQYLEILCPEIKTASHCKAIILQLWHGYRELQHNNNILFSYQANIKGARRQRQRRGLVNGVGYLANSLFGVLDDHFAEKYESDIGTIRSNENHLAELWKNQTSVVEAEFNLLKRTEDTMAQHHKLIHQKLNNIKKSFNQVTAGMQNLSMAEDFIETALIANNILFSLRNVQVTLLDTITNIYNGKFNFQLLSPEQLIRELNIISGQLPKDLSCPIDNFNLAEVYNLLQVRTRITLKYLIIEIKIPLISSDMYEIFRLIPVPYLVGTQTATVLPIADYAAISLKKDAVIAITEKDFNQCTQQNAQLLLCYLRKPIYHIKDDQSLCETEPGTRTCKSIIRPCADTWQELNKYNEYFYYCCKQCHMKLLCEDQVTAAHLSGNGLLTLKAGCIIKSADFLVYSHNSASSKIRISSEIEAPKIAPINHLINVSIPTSIPLDYSVHASQQLQEIREQIDVMKDSIPLIETVSTHDVHHYAAIYAIIGIITFLRIKKR